MQDWHDHRVNDLCLLNGPEREAALASLRKWVDRKSPVGASPEGPDGRVYRLVTAEDLLHVPSDRRDACFAELTNMIGWLRKTQDDPEEHVRKLLFTMRRPTEGDLFRKMVKAARGSDVVRTNTVLKWTDDGRDELGTAEPTVRFA